VGSRLITAKYAHLRAAWSLGKYPQALTALRMRALTLSIALVVHTILRISTSNWRKGTTTNGLTRTARSWHWPGVRGSRVAQGGEQRTELVDGGLVYW
jgi:hypothetical protein